MKLSDIQLPSNRKFGFFFAVVFALIGVYFIYMGSGDITVAVAYGFLVLAVIFLLVAFVKADILLPLNMLWMRFGLLLGLIVSPIVLGVIFFGLFTPIALVMKLFGRDELRLRLQNKTSHWKLRGKDDRHPDAFKQQF